MSQNAAKQLSKETGYHVEWNPSIGCYIINSDGKRWYPLYTKERVKRVAKFIDKEKNEQAVYPRC